MKVSIVMSTIDSRVELLERALWCYTKQTYGPIEVIVVADRPQISETKDLIGEYQGKLDVKYFEVGGPSGWRNGYGQNRGISESVGDIIVVTHPEVMMEFNSVQAIVDSVNGEDNVCSMLMWIWLTKNVNEWLRVNQEWREDMSPILNIVSQPGYRQVGKPSQEDKVIHRNVVSVLHAARIMPQNSPTYWQSAGMSRNTWLKIGGFTLMNTWGSMDRDFKKRKKVLCIPTRIAGAISYHQWHPRGPIKNEFEVFEYAKPEDAIRELRWE